MPTYDYECAACRRRFEVIHGVHAEGPTSCPLCGKGPVRKVITAANVHYKGSGWAKKERRTSVGSGASKSGGDGSELRRRLEERRGRVLRRRWIGIGAQEVGLRVVRFGRLVPSGTSKKTEKPTTSGASKTSD